MAAMTPEDVRAVLKPWVQDLAIDPYDAGLIVQEVDADGGTDVETFADILDGAGYPNLATIVLEAY